MVRWPYGEPAYEWPAGSDVQLPVGVAPAPIDYYNE